MSGIVLVGAQWGDEGKGKATDLLGSKIDVSVKYNGGNNAGHTVVVNGQSHALHLLPTGILTPGVTTIIGGGVVVDLDSLFEEIDLLQSKGVKLNNILVSSNAHIIPSYNKIIDGATEKLLGSRKIGTTGRGIGPTYADKMNRIGIRMQDLLDPSILIQKIEGALAQKNPILERVYNLPSVNPQIVFEELNKWLPRIKPLIANTSLFINKALNENKIVLFEGCQATMLDIDHGTYPFVTSSSTVSGGACTGIGIGPNKVDKVVAVAKAYTTRVGSGPFPTELTNEQGEWLREKGHEYGATTGRPRRCGWFDALVARYSVMVNGVTDLVITKLDILSELEKIPVCTAYNINGNIVNEMPDNQSDFHHAKPVYEYFDGWKEDISSVREFENLPENAKKYINALEKLSGVKISIIGVGAERDAVIERHNIV